MAKHESRREGEEDDLTPEQKKLQEDLEGLKALGNDQEYISGLEVADEIVDDEELKDKKETVGEQEVFLDFDKTEKIGDELSGEAEAASNAAAKLMTPKERSGYRGVRSKIKGGLLALSLAAVVATGCGGKGEKERIAEIELEKEKIAAQKTKDHKEMMEAAEKRTKAAIDRVKQENKAADDVAGKRELARKAAEKKQADAKDALETPARDIAEIGRDRVEKARNNAMTAAEAAQKQLKDYKDVEKKNLKNDAEREKELEVLEDPYLKNVKEEVDKARRALAEAVAGRNAARGHAGKLAEAEALLAQTTEKLEEARGAERELELKARDLRIKLLPYFQKKLGSDLTKLRGENAKLGPRYKKALNKLNQQIAGLERVTWVPVRLPQSKEALEAHSARLDEAEKAIDELKEERDALRGGPDAKMMEPVEAAAAAAQASYIKVLESARARQEKLIEDYQRALREQNERRR
ncbi:hypothetical protein KW786_00385 [Candidatus Parcubacteria bacterium]|nr:hypothetical protein [Candidatus Parcubacteria bacterium]